MSRKKPEIYQTFLASLKGGGVPQFGKRPNYFRFFLVKASLSWYLNFYSNPENLLEPLITPQRNKAKPQDCMYSIIQTRSGRTKSFKEDLLHKKNSILSAIRSLFAANDQISLLVLFSSSKE